jgi:hypothetical protein
MKYRDLISRVITYMSTSSRIFSCVMFITTARDMRDPLSGCYKIGEQQKFATKRRAFTRNVRPETIYSISKTP